MHTADAVNAATDTTDSTTATAAAERAEIVARVVSRRWVTTQELADYLQVSPRTVMNYNKVPGAPVVRLRGVRGQYRYDLEQYLAWLADGGLARGEEQLINEIRKEHG